MAHHDPIDSIIADLVTLDESFRDDETELRALIASFIAERPTLAIDPQFIASLRAKLVGNPAHVKSRRTLPTPSPYWWLIRLVPIGALALITLILMPAQGPNLVTPESDTVSVEQYENAPAPTSDVGRTQEAPVTPYAKTLVAPSGAGGSETASFAATSDQRVVPGNEERIIVPTGDTLTILSQKVDATFMIESVTLSTPGFIVIRTEGEGAIVGVSTLLSLGVSRGVTVPLTGSLRESTSLVATIYHDDGDRQFNEMSDTLVHDANGIPYEVRFSIDAPVTQSDTTLLAPPYPPEAALVRKIVANIASVTEKQVTVTAVYSVTWQNGCLGIETPGSMCTMGLVPGYQVLAEANGITYVFHTDQNGNVARAE